jgi:transposase InsO family protein
MRFRFIIAEKAHYPMRLLCRCRGLARQRFAVRHLNQVWAADITACWTREGWCYMAVILDLASRRVVGWAVRRTLTTELVTAALAGALPRLPRGARLLHQRSEGPSAGHLYLPRESRRGPVHDLDAQIESEEPLTFVQLIFPRFDRAKALADLREMNVSRETLFPGLDGLAQGLNHLVLPRGFSPEAIILLLGRPANWPGGS